MAAEFPGAIKSWADLVNAVDEILAGHHNTAYDEIEAIETYLGAHGDGVKHYVEGWVTFAVTNPTIGALPANALVTMVRVTTVEAFNGGGADELDIGYDGSQEAYVATLPVDEVGENVCAGPGAVDATGRTAKAWYTGGATAGKAHILIEYVVATATP
jgi:hypothetical protein